jgi:S1-C subfamily serine protease
VVEREKITTTKKRLLTSVYPVGRETRPAAAIKRNPAVVRIYSQLPGGKMLKGTGAIVRWHGRVCIVTVWHVVHDAKKITVWIAAKGRPGYYRARLVKTDPAFDGAVLEVTGLADSDAPAAEVAIGQAAIPQSGDALVYAGFGSDETYLEKTGTFIGYRGLPGQQMWDFMAISGNARNGDSGAPIFNKDGRLVGCLSDDNRPEWRGRPGAGRPMLGRGQAPEIQAIQPGRIHKLLDQAVGQ